MTDIVERLRDPVNNWNSGGRFEAADEIEKLREQNEQLHTALADKLAGDVSWAVDRTLEEAAKVAEGVPPIAAAIRALKEKHDAGPA